MVDRFALAYDAILKDCLQTLTNWDNCERQDFLLPLSGEMGKAKMKIFLPTSS